MRRVLRAPSPGPGVLREGFWVFHDLPGDGPFNVDHVAVGPQGLFAVETKGRPKGARGDDAGYRVVLRDEVLEFPGWRERKPLEQARRNAKWLGDWLSSAIGENRGGPTRTRAAGVVHRAHLQRQGRDHQRHRTRRGLHEAPRGGAERQTGGTDPPSTRCALPRREGLGLCASEGPQVTSRRAQEPGHGRDSHVGMAREFPGPIRDRRWAKSNKNGPVRRTEPSV